MRHVQQQNERLVDRYSLVTNPSWKEETSFSLSDLVDRVHLV